MLLKECFFADSPAVPASAGTHELFRGFSFVASSVIEDSMEKYRPLSAVRVPLPESRRCIEDEYDFEEVCFVLCAFRMTLVATQILDLICPVCGI